MESKQVRFPFAPLCHVCDDSYSSVSTPLVLQAPHWESLDTLIISGLCFITWPIFLKAHCLSESQAHPSRPKQSGRPWAKVTHAAWLQISRNLLAPVVTHVIHRGNKQPTSSFNKKFRVWFLFSIEMIPMLVMLVQACAWLVQSVNQLKNCFSITCAYWDMTVCISIPLLFQLRSNPVLIGVNCSHLFHKSQD